MRSYSAAMMSAAVLGIAQPAAAQGWWGSIGLGTGLQQVGCDICRGDGNGGFAARLAMGGTLSRRLQVGAELHGWTDKTDDIRFNFYSVMPALYWYPSSSVSYFLLGGAGLVRYKASNEDESMSSSSLGLTVGLGYELRVAPSYALTSFVTYTGSFLATLKYERTDVADARFSLFQVGIGFTRR